MAHELGDLIFSVVNAARLYNIDPESALEKDEPEVYTTVQLPGRADDFKREIAA